MHGDDGKTGNLCRPEAVTTKGSNDMSDNQNPETPPTPPPPAMPAATPPPPAPPVAAPPAPPMSASVPPPPVGQPVGQPGYPPAYSANPAAPVPGTRSTGKFVTGIVLTSLGGLWTLFGLRSIGVAIRSFGDNPAYAAGSLFGGLLIPVALLVVGIILIRSSKRKV